mmetsp:Transcript_4564/g.7905  ORF Transcript_4564/g.7905 Transcript_4564/m.7905 type:complete len:95 (-) Transcript_4564:759-1043(-)
MASIPSLGGSTQVKQIFLKMPIIKRRRLFTLFWQHAGMGVVQRMGLVVTDSEDRPRSPIRIHKATPFHGPPPPPEETPIEEEDEDAVLKSLTAP